MKPEPSRKAKAGAGAKAATKHPVKKAAKPAAAKKRTTAKPRPRNTTIHVPGLARVEGEGAMHVKVRNNKVLSTVLEIYEPPRFFEAFLRGRHFTEPTDITARICGICPVAYQMSSAQAMEDVCGVTIPQPIKDLRRLLYCGEWIESHALHIYLLHAPDFLGYPSAIHMAADYGEAVKTALRLKKLGNDIMIAVGGREIHPINVRVGGFYSSPPKAALKQYEKELEWALQASLDTVRLVSTFEFPNLERDYECVALRSETEYPIVEGRIVSSKGIDIPVQDFEKHFAEEHVELHNALMGKVIERGSYLVGPVARYNLNRDKLSRVSRKIADEVGLEPWVTNQFRSIIVRAVELVEAVSESLRLVRAYQPPEPSFVEVKPKAGVGCGISEAPRGILYHRYKIDAKGTVLEAKITPPTAQNQHVIEEDLHQFVQDHLDLSDERLTWELEQAIRNYDPCISCATHFLNLKIERE